MTIATPKFGIGASVLRNEDPAFITGHGNYTDDVQPEGTLRGYVVRSPVASGRFTISSTEAAKSAPGVHLVLTGEDVAHLGGLKALGMNKQPDGSWPATRDIPILCRDEVRHVGDAVAFVVADTIGQAQDAAELLEIDYEGGDVCASTAHALDDGAALVWPELGTNQSFLYQKGDADKVADIFAKAKHVTEIRFRNNRLVCNYMEPRAAIGKWHADEDRYVLTTGTQGVHSCQGIVAGSLGIPKEKLRVITPDVGGGFGPKGFTYREYPLVLEAAKRLGRPVKWVCDRTEHFLIDAHGRDNEVTAKMAMDDNGRFLALKIDLIANMGAYTSQFGPYIPYFGVIMATGVYDITAMDVVVHGVFTHTTPVDAYRGAGRPEAAFLIERLVDECARDMKVSPAEIRRRNFIRPEQFPYTTQGDRLYDVGEFDGHMTVALERADWDGFAARAEASKAAGKIRGIGMATYIEACAFAGSEPAYTKLNEDGTVTIRIGTQSNGQGHATAYAQFVAEKLNLPIDRISVHQGDTDELGAGGGTGGSRSIPLGGPSAARAGQALADKIRKIASDELEAAPADIELEDGIARVAGTDRSITFADIAKAAKSEDDVNASGEFKQNEATYPNGTHICELEIDPDTGTTEIVGYTIVDDFGFTVNPILLAGQVHGGVVQAIGQMLHEDTVHSEDGQLLTASFMDYDMPRADSVPFLHFETRNVPSTTNELGIKGAGEAGTIGAGPAVMNAVVDALWRAEGVRHIDMPASPARVWKALHGTR